MEPCNEVFVVYEDENIRLRTSCERTGKHRKHSAQFGGCVVTWPATTNNTDEALWEITREYNN